MKKTKSSKINTAVILAAGMGIRLREVIGFSPKGLLEFNGESLIMRSLQILKKQGIERVILVTGFQDKLYHKCLKNINCIPIIEFVHSPRYAETGSMHSLFVAKDHLEEDFLLLESDLLFESRAIRSVLNFDGSEVILASGKTGSNDEVFVYGEKNENFLSFESKTGIASGEIKAISKYPRKNFSIKGELVGISKISINYFKYMCFYHENNLNSSFNEHYEECISNICNEKKIFYLLISDLVWTEIDDQSHFDRAKNEIYPKLIKKKYGGKN